MRCPTHKKETIGNCQWCGKQICPFCVARKDGKKLYCESCATKLAGLKPVKIPKPSISRSQDKTEVKKEEGDKRRFILTKDGYLVLEQ